MYIFVIVWILFVFVYILFNAYGVIRVLKMRIKGDIIPVVVSVYLLLIMLIILISLIIIGTLDWGQNLLGYI